MKNPDTARNRTFRSSAKLVKNLISDLRYHEGRLDVAASVEECISLAGTLSEAVKKMGKFLDAPEIENVAPKRDATAHASIKNVSRLFAALDTDGPLTCGCCGKIRG